MAVLLVDIGNTSLKYVLLERASDAVEEPTRLVASSFAEVVQALLERLPAELDAAAIASVGHQRQVSSLQAALLPRSKTKVYVAAVENHWDGFELPYEDASKLGVDRWLAMLAVREALDADEVAVVADCGTAITIEYLRKRQMSGGIIAPGLRTMAVALRRDTATLPEVDVTVGLELGWGRDTESAIAAGCGGAVVGLLKRQAERASQDQHVAVKKFLTGGDANLLMPQLRDWQYHPSLVLAGLGLWLQNQLVTEKSEKRLALAVADA